MQFVKPPIKSYNLINQDMRSISTGSKVFRYSNCSRWIGKSNGDGVDLPIHTEQAIPENFWLSTYASFWGIRGFKNLLLSEPNISDMTVSTHPSKLPPIGLSNPTGFFCKNPGTASNNLRLLV